MARKNDTLSREFLRLLQNLDVLDDYLYHFGRSFPKLSYRRFTLGTTPCSWLLCAFDWEMCPSIDWRAVHNLWLVRLNALKKNNKSIN